MKTQEERIKIFESTVKNTRFEQLSMSSDIGQGIIMGYTQCQEDSKDKKYTEEDMRQAFIAGVDCESKNSKNFEQFINSLNKQ
jgi:dsRNA-specific ribonuclease